MKECNFAVEACLGIPIHYENWYEHMSVCLSDEQFERYCNQLKIWRTSDEWKKWNNENGEDFFIHRDLPDIYDLIMSTLKVQAPKLWDERIKNYIDQINIYTAEEIWNSIDNTKTQN